MGSVILEREIDSYSEIDTYVDSHNADSILCLYLSFSSKNKKSFYCRNKTRGFPIKGGGV